MLSWVSVICEEDINGNLCLCLSLVEYSILPLTSTVKSLYKTNILFLITVLRTMMVCITNIVVLVLAPPNDYRLTFQMCNLAFQMRSCNTLYFSKMLNKSQGMWEPSNVLNVFSSVHVRDMLEIIHSIANHMPRWEPYPPWRWFSL